MTALRNPTHFYQLVTLSTQLCLCKTLFVAIFLCSVKPLCEVYFLTNNTHKSILTVNEDKFDLEFELNWFDSDTSSQTECQPALVTQTVTLRESSNWHLINLITDNVGYLEQPE